MKKEYQKKSKFTEIFKLKEMLQDEDIPFRFEHEGEINTPEEHYLIIISSEKKDKRILCDACQASHSIGHQMDLIEICGGLTAEESNQGPFLGYISAADAFKRFKYCYKNNTRIYYKTKRRQS